MADWKREHWAVEDVSALTTELLSHAEADYLAFHGKLVHTAAPLHGVRQPVIKSYAKQISAGNWREYLQVSCPVSYEEIMVRGLVIAYARAELAEQFQWTTEFLPLIDNWAVNDFFVSAFHSAGRHPEQTWQFLQPLLSAEREFTVRFAVTMLMTYFLTEEYVQQVLRIYGETRHEGYYVKMAVAWGISACFAKYREPTLALLRENSLDAFTYGKAIQKTIESYRVSPADKALLREMRQGRRTLS